MIDWIEKWNQQNYTYKIFYMGFELVSKYVQIKVWDKIAIKKTKSWVDLIVLCIFKCSFTCTFVYVEN